MNKEFSKSKIINLIAGPLLFAISMLFIPESAFDFKARVAVATVIWMGYWWVSLPVGVGVTALLPIVINGCFNVVPMEAVTNKYFSEIVILLLGAELIALSWEETGLDKRISLKALCLIGPSMRQQVAVWFLVSALLSTLLPNAVVCAVMVPIAISMLKFIGEGEVRDSKTAPVILASIAWGAGIGGLGTPLGGAMNLVAVEYIQQITSTEFMYLSWVKRLFPMLIIILTVNLIYLMMIRPKGANLPGTKQYFNQLYGELHPMNSDEKISLLLFIIPVVLSFARPLYLSILPGLKPAYAFLIFGMLTFVLFKKDGAPLLTWNTAEKNIIWGMLFLFAGGLAMGTLITQTGAADSIAALVSKLDLKGGLATIFVFVSFTVLLAEVSSNTAAAAISVPIVISITRGLGLDPLPYIYITAAAFNCAYIFPTSIRAIPVGYGLNPKYLFKNGFILTIIGIITISLLGYVFMLIWPGFSSAGV
jgi:sodium-dependent dicarboxylate transporter 2/3/5